MSDDRIAAALERIATAMERSATASEQRVLEEIDARPTGDDAPLPLPPPDEFPAFAAQQTAKPPAGHCPTHREAWKFVPPGISKSTGRPYEGFWTCPERGCKHKPSPLCRVDGCPDGPPR